MPEGDINQAVELFKSRDQRKRRWAIDLAAELGTSEAAALLVKALQDQSWSLREYAVEKAIRLGRPMVAPLCRLLNSGIWFSRAAAVQALRGIGDVRALGPLVLLVVDPNRSVADAAKAAIGDIVSRADPARLAEQDARLSREQRSALAGAAKGAPVAAEPAGTAASQDAADGDGEAQKLQQLRLAIKTASKQEARYEDEEP